VPAPVDRLSPADLSQLVTDVGPVPLNVGALLVLPGADPAALAVLLADRLAAVRRFRQVVRTAPPGLGRPYWVDDPAFDPTAHVRVGARDRLDEDGLAALGAQEVVVPLDRTRPPWRVVVAHDPAGTVAALLVMHHVLADGVGGLGVLVGLVDGAPGMRPGGAPPRPAPAPGPDRAALAADAWRGRRAALARLPRLVRGLRHAGTELGPRSRPDRTPHAGAAPSSGLNARTGPRRAVHLVDTDLTELRAGARTRGATVNDALLVAAAAAMRHVLVDRGAAPPEALVLSVPVSGRPPARPEAAAAAPAPEAPSARPARQPDLGNQVGVMPVRTPTTGPLAERLSAVAAHTRARKAGARGASAVLVGPLFRTLAALHLYRWFVDRQRLVNAFLTNLPGPPAALTLGGHAVTRLVPVTITAGNVGVAFAALSYAGRLVVTVITDPDVVPEGAALAGHLSAGLADVAALARG
jgi:WS/DGAT/MGAT family acyltransferase